jgi:hypothetical protein
MDRQASARVIARPAAAFILAAVAVLAIVASGALGSSPAPSPSPSPTAPGATPTPTPTGSPVATPTPQPSEAPSDEIVVDLDNLTDHDVSVVVIDKSGTLAGAKSGTPGDGMTVRWFDSKVTNIDATTIRIVWVGLPRDEQVRLTISDADGGYLVRIVQEAPPAYSDAIGFDRIIELSFDGPVSADDVTVTVT